jgi:FemAB-related protein (PEP-CTERM system-associated)
LALPADADAHAEWDRYVHAHADGTLFHTLAWRDAVRETFGHEDFYWTAVREGRIVGLLPIFLVKSRIAGRMLVSVPYAVGGGILADDPSVAETLFSQARRTAEEKRCRLIDFRSERAVLADVRRIDRYVGFRRRLPVSVEEVLAWLPRKARAAARNAREKYGLTVSHDDQHLREVWRLYTLSMRRLGSLNYPFRFFERLIALTPGKHWTSMVRWNGRTVAGLVTFLFRDRVMPYFVGTTAQAHRCSAANYLYLTTMERGIEQGFRVFDFGRTRRDNTGSYDFKRFHGFEPQPLGYQCHSMTARPPADFSPSNPVFRLARRIWPYLPLSCTRVLGARLARQLPG